MARKAAAAKAGEWMAVIETAAYQASIELAKAKGSFPLFDRDAYLASGHVRDLPEDIRAGIARSGIRNALLTSIAPTGTISLFAGNVSSGIEPIFSLAYRRKVLQPDGSHREEPVEDYAVRLYRRLNGPDAALPEAFVTTADLTPSEHLNMQAAVQAHVDSSISKTINVPQSMSFEDFKAVYAEAFDLGLKGCTTFRPNPVTGSVLSDASAPRGSRGGTGAAARSARRRRLRRSPRAAPASSTCASPWSAAACCPASPTSCAGPIPIMPSTSPSTT